MSIKKPFGVKRSAKPLATSRKFSVEQIRTLCKTPILKFCLAKKNFKASDLMAAVRAFDVYEKSNAIGDVIGHGYGDESMGLFCVPGLSPRHYEACYENAALVYDSLSDSELEQVMTELDLVEDALREKIGALRKLPNNLDHDESVETGDLMSDLNDDLERFSKSQS